MMKMKMIAIAAAMVSMAGAARADLTPSSSNNGSLVLWAFNTANNAYYIRDLGYVMNDFLPSGVTTSAGNGGVTGDKTPEAGLTLNAGNTASFADSLFATWYAGQAASTTVWGVSSYDNQGTGGSSANVKRMITSTTQADLFVTNGAIDFYTSTGNAGTFSTLMPTGFSTTGVNDNLASTFGTNFNLGLSTLGSVGQTANLFYYTRAVPTGQTASQSIGSAYANSLNSAVITLGANGDFSYTLASAVPLPPTAWLMGAGLLAIGGIIRRRSAAV